MGFDGVFRAARGGAGGCVGAAGELEPVVEGKAVEACHHSNRAAWAGRRAVHKATTPLLRAGSNGSESGSRGRRPRSTRGGLIIVDQQPSPYKGLADAIGRRTAAVIGGGARERLMDDAEQFDRQHVGTQDPLRPPHKAEVLMSVDAAPRRNTVIRFGDIWGGRPAAEWGRAQPAMRAIGRSCARS